MRVVITSHGSTGDIFPMIALGVAMRDAGHAVRFATSPPFEAEVIAAGLEYAGIPPRWSREELAHWMGRLQLCAGPLFQLRELYRAALPHIAEAIDETDALLDDTDLLVSSYLFPMNRAIAERHGVPFATFAFAHNTVPSRYYPPDGFPRLRGFPQPVQHVWNRWLWRIGNVAVDTIINMTIARQLRARGLPLVKDFFSKPAKLVLVAVSPGLMRPPVQLNKRFKFVGYCRWQAPQSDALERKLRAFTQGRAVPVLTFGSMVYQDPHAWMRRLAAAWPRERPLIVQTGWAGFQPLADCPHIWVLGPVSHDQLFAHASVVIHHGGAGTTASVLHAGRPHVIVPHIADQNFFAHETIRLGCGIKIRQKSWPENLAAAVAAATADPRLARNAARTRAILLAENGPGTAVAELERFVHEDVPVEEAI